MDIPVAKIWEDGLRTDPSKKSFEWWYFDGNFKDGSTIVVTFHTKSPSKAGGPLTPLIEFTINRPDGGKIFYTHEYSPSEFSASKEKCDVTIGTSSASGDLHKYKLHVDFPEITADLEFEGIAPSFSTSVNHPTKPEAFGWFCAIPYGKVKVKLKDKNGERNLEGTGYHDHNWGSVNLSSVCDYWYWGRGNAGDYSMIYAVMYLPKILGGKTFSTFYLAKKDKILLEDANHLEVSKIDINPVKPKKGHLPNNLSFNLIGRELGVEIDLSKPKLIESRDPISDEGKLKQKITRLFSTPLYVRFNADLNLKLTEDGKEKAEKGNGLYEIMILH